MAKAAQAPRAWQRMLSGRRLDLLDPSPVDVEISDIAHGLARVARWNGQTRGDHAYSVAQHSLLVDDIHAQSYPSAPAGERLAVLLHDAPEYVIGDMISPFKAIVGGDYKAVEARLQGAIHLRFGLAAQTTQALHKRIKRCDRIAAYFEAVNLAGFTSSEAHRYFGRPAGFAPDAFDLTPLAAKRVERAFLQRFAVLDKARAHAAQGAT